MPADQILDDAALIRLTLGSGVERKSGAALSAEDAFQKLIERHQERIFKLLARFTRNTQDTEDLAQDVFVKVYRKLDTFQFDSSFYTWLYRIAVNTASDWASRKRHRCETLSEEVSELDRGRDDPRPLAQGDAHREQPFDPLLRSEMATVTRHILDRLPPKYRMVLILREYEDLSYTEMAQTLRVSIGTVESRLFRARQRFKAELIRLHPDLVPGGGVPDDLSPESART